VSLDHNAVAFVAQIEIDHQLTPRLGRMLVGVVAEDVDLPVETETEIDDAGAVRALLRRDRRVDADDAPLELLGRIAPVVIDPALPPQRAVVVVEELALELLQPTPRSAVGLLQLVDE